MFSGSPVRESWLHSQRVVVAANARLLFKPLHVLFLPFFLIAVGHLNTVLCCGRAKEGETESERARKAKCNATFDFFDPVARLQPISTMPCPMTNSYLPCSAVTPAWEKCTHIGASDPRAVPQVTGNLPLTADPAGARGASKDLRYVYSNRPK